MSDETACRLFTRDNQFAKCRTILLCCSDRTEFDSMLFNKTRTHLNDSEAEHSLNDLEHIRLNHGAWHILERAMPKMLEYPVFNSQQ